MISIILFALLLVVGSGFFAMNAMKIRSNILLGRDIDRSDHSSERWKTMLLVAFGQKKMFSRPLPALLHLAIYAAFVITQIELIEIVIDGLSGSHRFFRGSLGGFYTFMISFIEVLSVLALIATFVFLSRRNLLKLPRFNMKELMGWPRKDANLILIMEIVLVACIFTMNGADEAIMGLKGESYGFAVSSLIGHLHIVLAFPNTYYSNLNAKGKFTNMESVTAEVKLMLDPTADPFAAPAEGATEPQRFGAKDVTDLTWKNLLDAYSCTECGRCTSSCPANNTGKKLSPRKIMMDTRDRLVEVGENIRKNGKDFTDGKSLLGDYISEEEIWACTSCNACVQECPVNIDPLSIIVDLRRFLVMEESKMPTELTGMLTNIENNGAPWQFSPNDRLNWAHED